MIFLVNPKYLSYLRHQQASKYKCWGTKIAVGRITRLCNRVGLQIYGYFPNFTTKVYY